MESRSKVGYYIVKDYAFKDWSWYSKVMRIKNLDNMEKCNETLEYTGGLRRKELHLIYFVSVKLV